MIEVKDLVKKYGSHEAVRGISFKIESGKIYGFLGPNGAGKSTTMNIITGCLAATSGSVTINGHDIFEDPLEAKRHIGYLPEIPPVYTDMTPEEYLMFVAEAKRVSYGRALKQISSVLELTGLTEVRRRLIGNLSKGYRQRVGIAAALIGDPEIIILDEPTVGLDPKQIIEIRNLIRRLGQIKTVILSSHILGEVSEICDHVIIISKGEIVADDSIAALEASLSSESHIKLKARATLEEARRVLGEVDSDLTVVTESVGKGGVCSLELDAGEDMAATEKIFSAFSAAGVVLSELCRPELTLESVFLKLTDGDISSAEDTERSVDALSGEDMPEEGGGDENDTDESAEDDGEDDYVPMFSSKKNDEENE